MSADTQTILSTYIAAISKAYATGKAIAIMEEFALSVRLDPMDALVFATALDYDITLCSGNEKHFRQLEGLRATVFRPA